MSKSSAIAMLLALVVGACGDNPAKPVQPDGLHRVPVNRVTPVSAVPAGSVASPAPFASPAFPTSPASSMHGARS